MRPLLATSIFVDDGLAICKDKSRLQDMINYLKTNFDIIEGDADMYIDFHITRKKVIKSIYIDQSRFIESLLVKYGFSGI